MKKVLFLASLFCLLFSCSGMGPAQAEDVVDEPDDLYARSAVLMDADSGRVLFGKEEDEKRPMASTTKIMTCILALEHMEEGQTATVSDLAVCQPKVRLGVRGKEEYFVEDLLYSLMLESHNDSAVVIAEAIAGSVEAFAGMMNEKARQIGCADTHFVTPNGLDGADAKGIHATTAADLARIMRYCIMESPEKDAFLTVTRTRSYQFTNVAGTRSFSCSNHNAFLDMMEGALSGKTGFTADAGYCYVGALTRDGKTFIVVLLACGWPDNKGYKWKDTRTLMEYGMENYDYRDVWEEVPDFSVCVENGVPEDGKNASVYGKNASVAAGLSEPPKEFKLLLRKDEQVEVKKEICDVLQAPVEKGTPAGSVSYVLDGKVIARYEIVTRGQIRERDFFWCLQEMLRRVCA